MRIKCAREDLLSKIQITQKAISTKSMLPVLSGILIKTKGDKIELSATDLEISIRTELKLKAIEKGSLVVPARLLTDILSNLDESSIELGLIKEKGQLEILAGDSQYNLNIWFEEDFPKIPDTPKVFTCQLSAVSLQRAVKGAIRAVSKDETKPVLTGILVIIERNVLKMVATDSYRLVVCEEELKKATKEPLKIIVPARSLRELSRIISDLEDETVNLSLTDNQVVFGVGETEVISRLIEGEFPQYEQLFPEKYEKTIRINKERLVGAVKRASFLAQDNTPLKLLFANNLLTISSSTQDVGQALERVNVEYPGEETRIAFNPTYFMDGIAGIEDEELFVEITDPLKPVLIRPVGEQKFLYLLMPVRVT